MALLFPLAAAAAGGALGILDFYAGAESFALHPPHDGLRIACSKQRAGRYVHVVIEERGQVVRYVGYTDKMPQRFEDLSDYKSNPRHRFDWTYVYDRNGDGRVDYLVHYQGTSGIKPDDFPADFRTAASKHSVTRHEIDYLLAHARQLFWHLADDNFDGHFDGFVGPVWDPQRPGWVEAFAVLRDANFDGTIDDEWLFRKKIVERSGKVPRDEGGYRLTAEPKRRTQPERFFYTWELELADINAVVAECDLGKKLKRMPPAVAAAAAIPAAAPSEAAQQPAQQ